MSGPKFLCVLMCCGVGCSDLLCFNVMYSAVTLTTHYASSLFHTVLCWRCSVVRQRVRGGLLEVGGANKHWPPHVLASASGGLPVHDHSFVPQTIPIFSNHKHSCTIFDVHATHSPQSARDRRQAQGGSGVHEDGVGAHLGRDLYHYCERKS